MTSLVGIQVDNSINELLIEPYSFITTIEVGDETIQCIELNQDALLIDNPAISIIEIAGIGLTGPPGIQGPVGPQGPPGPSGDAVFGFETINITISNLSNVSHVLPHIPRSGTLKLFLNGLMENQSSFSLSGNVVNFSTLELGMGDLLTFDYQYQVI